MTNVFVVGPILVDRLKEKILKPLKGILCIHNSLSCVCVCVFVCVSVCPRATEHIFSPRKCVRFLLEFSMFSLYNTRQMFGFMLPVTVFFNLGMRYLG